MTSMKQVNSVHFYKICLVFLFVGQVLCLSSVTTTLAQNNRRLQTHQVEKRGNYFSYQTARIAAHQPYLVRPDFLFTSVVLQIDPAYTYQGAYIISENDTLQLLTDEHQPQELEKNQSGLVVFVHTIKEFMFYPGEIRGDIVFNFLNAGKLTIKKKNLRTEQETHDACAEPGSISQQAWRKGLPAPNYSRSFHQVDHIIIHHAATSNALTDYTDVVRNIYLWHTQTNEWSDIGYNYLIAQDGTIYKGRDPEDGEQDNVKGAHFCGENTGTMGICLLGTYTDVAPTDTTIASLLKLIAWKVSKEQLDPLDFEAHPANPNLGVIAGHRDGCATLCPGDKVYEKMQTFREFADLFVHAACQDPVLATDDEVETNQIKVYPVPATDEVHLSLDYPRSEPPARIQKIMLYDLQGKEVAISPTWQGNELSFSTQHLPSGIYVLKVVLKKELLERKIIVQ